MAAMVDHVHHHYSHSRRRTRVGRYLFPSPCCPVAIPPHGGERWWDTTGGDGRGSSRVVAADRLAVGDRFTSSRRAQRLDDRDEPDPDQGDRRGATRRSLEPERDVASRVELVVCCEVIDRCRSRSVNSLGLCAAAADDVGPADCQVDGRSSSPERCAGWSDLLLSTDRHFTVSFRSRGSELRARPTRHRGDGAQQWWMRSRIDHG